ncbi:beta-lactamase class A [Paenibacillus rhizosphaerae]|uniref:Beta-lactamase n=1 Tax=Paenibacillus rhizosphaerae TaxID=297318 RepID=A0A839TMH6_9BACL|nr:serine hydrolase [Paenibacillus rhizosphaerae]MBB3128006.1 beta-lactamase class A [Paenibacillus rhizosphaerae]
MTRRRKPVLRRTLMTTIAATALLTSLLPATSGAAPGKGLSAIASALNPILREAEKNGIRMSVGIRDLSGSYGHETLLLGSREPYMPASTIKLAVVSALMQQVDRGQLSLADQVTVTSEDVVGGSGSLQFESFPQDLTLERLARLMITQSDNTATNVLIDKVGMDRVQLLMDQLDLRTMHLGRKMFAAAPSPAQDNYIDAADLTELLSQIYQSPFLTVSSRNQIIAWMARQEVNTKFGAALPDAPIAHKTGENANVTHDAGYFLVPGHELAVSVLLQVTTTQDFDEAQRIGNPIVQKAASAIYSELVKDQEASAGSSLTRAEFTSLVARELGLTSAADRSSRFPDIGDDSPYAADIAAARQAGLVRGTADGRFDGPAVITRAEMAAIAVRAFEFIHGEASASGEFGAANQGTVSSWAAGYVSKALRLGMMDPDAARMTDQPASRQEGFRFIIGIWNFTR